MILASGVESCVLGGGFIPGPVSTVLGTLHCRCGVFRLTKGKPFPPPPHTLTHTHTNTHRHTHRHTHPICKSVGRGKGPSGRPCTSEVGEDNSLCHVLTLGASKIWGSDWAALGVSD